MTEIKVGDTVVSVFDEDIDIKIGNKYVVTYVDDYTIEFNDDVGYPRKRSPRYYRVISSATPPQKITKNGYEYSLVGPVKPEWLVDGVWVVDKETGRKYRVSYDNGVYTFNNGTREVIIDFTSLPTRFRPHTASDWKWGDWAMYKGKRVFVMSSLTHDNLVGVSFPNIDGKDLTDPSEQWDFAEVSKLTPTF